MGNTLNKNDVVDSLGSTLRNNPLSARMGSELNQRLEKIEASLGEIITGETITNTVPSGGGIFTHIRELELGQGTYIVRGRIGFPYNSTGYRWIGISEDDTSFGILSTNAGHSSYTNYLNGTVFITVPDIEEQPEPTIVYLNTRQTSGSDMTVTNVEFEAIRIL